MPQVHEILELDLLTLREHTERAGDALDPERLRKTIEDLLPVAVQSAHGDRVASRHYVTAQQRVQDQPSVHGLPCPPRFQNNSREYQGCGVHGTCFGSSGARADSRRKCNSLIKQPAAETRPSLRHTEIRSRRFQFGPARPH